MCESIYSHSTKERTSEMFQEIFIINCSTEVMKSFVKYFLRNMKGKKEFEAKIKVNENENGDKRSI